MAKQQRREHSSSGDAGEEGYQLQVDEDVRFQRREHVMRQIGTTVLCLFLIAAIAGMFGGGPLSGAGVRSPDSSLIAHYERFARNRAPTLLRLSIRAPPDGPIELSFNAAFAEAIEIEHILLEPTQMMAGAGRYAFTIATGASDSLTTIIVRYRPESLGFLPVVATLDGSIVRFRQFVFP